MPEQVDLMALAGARRDELVSFARRLIATPSMSGEEGDAAALVGDEMRRLGYDEVRVDEVGNVIGLLRGQGSGRSVMLNTHLDHVAAGDPADWTDPPFSATVRDGALYGRGAVDIKGPMACQVYAGALLRAAGLRPAGDLYVVGAVLEECGGLGSEHLARTVPVDCAVIGEPSANTLRRGHRGRLGLVAEVRGRAAHGSVPAQAINPHYSISSFLARLRALPMRVQEPFGASSVAPTLYETDNSSANVIPGVARVYLDWRNVPDETVDDVLKLLQPVLQESLLDGADGEVRLDDEHMITYTGVERTVPSIFRSFEIAEDHAVVVTARRALEGLLSRPFPPGIWAFATDAGHLMHGGMPTIGFGPGDPNQAHVRDEHIDIAEMVEALAANAALVLALGEQ